MNWLNQLLSRRRPHHDLDEEIAFHLDEKIKERVGSGMSMNESTAAARREFGDCEKEQP